MKVVEGEGKSVDEIRHDKAGPGRGCLRSCRYCKRDAAQAKVDKLVAEGKLVRG